MSASVKKGDIVSMTDYVLVEKVVGTKMVVTDVDREIKFEVSGQELLDTVKSADYFGSTEKVTKTKAAEILVASKNIPFTVSFTKLNGDSRRLRGRLLSSEHLMGRSAVEDLDIDVNQHRLRQVDHRTIDWLIVDEVKYVVK